jgi:DNA modification methylase
MKCSQLLVNEGQVEGLPTNPRSWTKADIDRLARSLEETPELFEARPCIVYPLGDKYIVLGGNMRLTAAKTLKYKDVPCIVIPAETPIDKLKEIVVKDNGAFGAWDFDELANKWDDLPLTDWGVPAWEEKHLEETEQEAAEDDFDETADQVETRCQKGDIWKLGEHRLMCGDSTSETDVAELMDGATADVVLTDPPYGMGLDTDYSTMKNHLDFAKEKGFKGGKKYDAGRVDEFHPEMVQAALNLGAKEVFLWGADFYADLLPARNEGSWIVWDKRANNTGDIEADESSDKMYGSCFELCWSKCKHKRDIARIKWAGVFGTEQEFDHKRYHPTQKPVKLSGWFISRYSKQGDIIVDLFGGSGSTLMAAEQLGRKCYMVEIDPHYCDVILARWEKLTGKEATKIE